MARGGLNRVRAVAANTYRETVRERVLYNLVFFAMIMTLAALLLKELSIRQDDRIIKDVGLASIEIFGTLIAIFVGVGLVAKEVEKRSLYPLLAKPLSRDEFLLGKAAGLGFTLLVNVGTMTLGLFLTLALTGNRPTLALVGAVFPMLVGLWLTVALALLFSTVVSSTLAAVCSFGLVVAGRFSDVIRNMREVAPGVPDWLVRGLYFTLPNFRHFDVKDRVVHGDPVTLAQLAWISGYGFTYIAVVLALAMLAFRSREL